MFGSLTNGETRREAQKRNGRKDKRHILDFWVMFQCLSTCRVLENVATTLPRLERFLSEEQRPEGSLALSATVERTTSSSVAISLERKKEKRVEGNFHGG